MRRLALACLLISSVGAFAGSNTVVATHAAGGYLSGCVTVQTVTITNMFEYSATNVLRLLSLLWTNTLPTGWSLTTNTWGDGTPEAKTSDNEIVFKGDLTNNPIVFYYQVSVPTNETGVKAISAYAEYQFTGDVNPHEIAVEPDPLLLNQSVPPAPIGLTVSKGTYTDKVTLSWTAAASASGYEIWRNTLSDTSTAGKVSSSDVVGTSYNDTIAEYAVLYTYWVKTKGASGVASAFSASDTGWRGLLLPTVSASRGLPREVKVTWSETAGAMRYEVWKNVANNSSTAILLVSGLETSYRDMQVLPGLRYYYWVKALCAQGDSGFGTSSEGWCGAAKWDFNGDGRAEPWYYHEASGRWYVMMTTNELSTAVLGGAGWVTALGDYDGDGKTDPAVYNGGDPSTASTSSGQAGSGQGGTLKMLMSGSGYAPAAVSMFGGAGYTAAVGDYDGDGKADPAIYAEASGTWQIAMSGSKYELVVGSGFGAPGYKAVPTDYDGDGKADPAVQEEASGNWFMLLSGNNYQSTNVQFGMSGYVPVPGEYGGLGHAQIAVYNEASGNWYIRGESNTVHFGMPGYLPMPADYDGDRYEDEAVIYRSRYDTTWYLKMSTEGFKIISGRKSRP